MSKEELVHLDGEVILIAKGGNFRVKLDNGHEVLAKLAGKVRRHRIRVVLGDRVTVAVSPSTTRMRWRRTLPASLARTSWPLSSLTRKLPPFAIKMTSPSRWTSSSLLKMTSGALG